MCKSKFENKPFALKTPCANCPFRSDGAFSTPLGKRRIEGIVESIRSDEYFACHKTTKFDDEDDSGNQVVIDNGTWCAGALAMLEATGETNSHWKLRYAQFKKLYNPKDLKLTNTPVFQTWEDLINYHDSSKWSF